jgi:curved DNA-binding protein CbpA
VVVKPSRRRPHGFYDVLGVSVGASKEAIIRAWRKAAFTHHPDKHLGPQAKAAATVKFREVTHAKDVLLNANYRDVYDKQFGFVVGATVRVRECRRRKSTKERERDSAKTVARRLLAKEKAHVVRRRPKRAEVSKGKKSFQMIATGASKLVPPGEKWVFLDRTPRERKADKRLSPVQALPKLIYDQIVKRRTVSRNLAKKR